MKRSRNRSVCWRLPWFATGVFLLALSACGKQESAPATSAVEPPKAPTAPVKVATKPENVAITGVHTGLGIGQHNHVARETSLYAPTDTIVVSVYSDGSAKTASISVRWMASSGNVLAEDTKAVTYNGSLATPFSFSAAQGLPAGRYKAEVRLNDWLAQTATFEVN